MKIKKIITTSIIMAALFSISYFTTIFLGRVFQKKTVNKILAQAREAAKSLKTVKTRGKTLVGSKYTIKNDGVIDYVNKRFYITQTQDAEILNAIYYIDDTTYMYNGVLKSWVKFGEDLNIFGDVLDKEKLLSAFPVDFKGTGFQIAILGEEETEGQPCYILQSTVVDEGLAKEFMIKFLDKFTSGKIANSLKEDKGALNEYLEQYIKNSDSTQWVSKDNFFVVKTSNKYIQNNEQGLAVTVENETIYYDFNQPVTIELSDDAQGAKLITAEDIGLGE